MLDREQRERYLLKHPARVDEVLLRVAFGLALPYVVIEQSRGDTRTSREPK